VHAIKPYGGKSRSSVPFSHVIVTLFAVMSLSLSSMTGTKSDSCLMVGMLTLQRRGI